MKPAYAILRQFGHVNSPYIDDSYLQGGDYRECLANVLDTVKCFLHCVLLSTHISQYLPQHRG